MTDFRLPYNAQQYIPRGIGENGMDRIHMETLYLTVSQ